jgi:hypothetical protein
MKSVGQEQPDRIEEGQHPFAGEPREDLLVGHPERPIECGLFDSRQI